MNRDCPRCQKSIPYSASTCPACSADIARELEIAAFHQPAIDSARRMILWAGLVYLAIPFLLFLPLGQLTGATIFLSYAFLVTLAICAGLCGAHLVLRKWARREPFFASLTALALYVAAVVATGDVQSGIVGKVVIVVILSRAVLAGYRVRKLRALPPALAGSSL